MEFNPPPNKGLMDPLKIGSQVEEIKKGRWQWRSDPDPWSKFEVPQWEFYSLKYNYLIEKASYDQQDEVDLGDYVISIKHMIQRKKDAAHQQRPIRRIDWKDIIEEIDRSVRYFETELPKTMNKVFGSLGDFVRFFSRRNPEILDFANQFEECERSHDLIGLNQKIAPKLVSCLQDQLLKSILEQLQDSSLSGFKRKILLETEERHKKLILLFQKESQSFEEFYRDILKAYTMNTSLYEKLNRYLRNESWVEIDRFLPYVFCLCKAFFHLKLQRNSNPNQQLIEIDSFSQGPKSITLYRGTAFDESALSFYKNSQTIQEPFSWNSVTSTSLNAKVAEEFMYHSVNLKNKKYPVLFIIEIPILNDENKSEYLEWIDIHQFSEIPKEDEVILAPGSVFELQEASTDQDKRTIIKLKMKSKIQFLAHTGLIMPGALQREMLINKQAKIVCLEGDELFSTLQCLTGNKLVEEIEFCLCTFDKKLLAIMIETLATLERAEEVRFISCEYKDHEKLSIQAEKEFKRWNILKVDVFEMNDFYQVFTIQNEENRGIMGLREFQINFASKRRKSDLKMDPQLLQGLQNLTQLTSLTLDFNECWQVTDEGIRGFASQGLRYLVQLTYLTIDFSKCREITDKGLSSLASQGLQQVKNLVSLSFDFSDCPEITDKGVQSLASEGLKHLTQLISLTLQFKWCNKITNEGVLGLASQGLQYQANLTSLALSFSGCKSITDEGVRILADQGLRALPQLKSLTLDFQQCRDLIDEGICNLASQGLRYLTQLTSFSLDFSLCKKITDKGVSIFAAEGLYHLTQLTSLTLKFKWCKKLTNEGVLSLASQALQYQALTSLSLTFSGCTNIADKELNNLGAQVLRHLTQLTSLSLDFSSCESITDEGVKSLASCALQHFSKLKSLALDFAFCKNITDEALIGLTSQGLKYLTQLTSLTIGFSYCDKITDKGANGLISEELQHLTQLVYFAPNFTCCWGLTNQGRRNVVSQTLRHLNQLVLINESDGEFKFGSNLNISNLQTYQTLTPSERGKLSFRRVFDKHEQLASDKEFPTLNLQNSPTNLQMRPSSLEYSQQFEDSLIGTSQQTQHFSYPVSGDSTFKVTCVSDDICQLTTLDLDFRGCKELTDEGMNNMYHSDFQPFTQFAALSFHFSKCLITDQGLGNFMRQLLLNSTKLTSLTLDLKHCEEITDEGIEKLVSKEFQNLTQLVSLSLNLPGTFKITDKAISSLASRLQCLLELESLTLGFSQCYRISDKGFYILASQGLRFLTKLTSLNLNFYSSQITDEGIHNLVSQGLQSLTQMTSLTLAFTLCNNFSEKGVLLASQVLRNLTKLSSLTLNFSNSPGMTDIGVNYLISQVFKHLTQLRFLTLDFSNCKEITTFTFSNLSRILYYFGFVPRT